MESITRSFSAFGLAICATTASYFLWMWLQSRVSWRGILAAALALLVGVSVEVLEAHIHAPGIFVGDMPWRTGILFAVVASIGIVLGIWFSLKERNANALTAVTACLLVLGVLFGTRVLAYWESGSHKRPEPKSGIDALLEVLEG